MATDNEKLFAVVKRVRKVPGGILAIEVHRTRKAARDLASARNKRSRKYHYSVKPAKWGPEQ